MLSASLARWPGTSIRRRGSFEVGARQQSGSNQQCPCQRVRQWGLFYRANNPGIAESLLRWAFLGWILLNWVLLNWVLLLNSGAVLAR